MCLKYISLSKYLIFFSSLYAKNYCTFIDYRLYKILNCNKIKYIYTHTYRYIRIYIYLWIVEQETGTAIKFICQLFDECSPCGQCSDAVCEVPTNSFHWSFNLQLTYMFLQFANCRAPLKESLTFMFEYTYIYMDIYIKVYYMYV